MKKLDIIYEDKSILVVNKPSNMLTISDGSDNITLYSMARSYVKKQHKSNKIFIVHRLDKDTSGVLLFAKSEVLKKYLQDNWKSITNREYIAVVDGVIKNKKGVIKEYLKETKTHMVYVTKKGLGEYAETHYEVLGYKDNKTILKINIVTGKKNQIRVGFSNLGFPILGDKKYGSKEKIRLMLHASRLDIKINSQEYSFRSNLPREFLKYYKF